MKFGIFFKAFLISIIVIFVASCDKDYNEIGTNILGDDHFGMSSETFGVTAYNKDLGAVQTNNLPINSLGCYSNPNSVFGKTKASFVTQLELATVDPSFIDDPSNIVVDSVYLYVPYFSSLVSTDSNGDSTYTLDSIYNSSKKIKLHVYESGYFLGNLDTSSDLQESQKYYSNQKSIFDSNIIGSMLNNSTDTSQNEEFAFKSNQIKFFKLDNAGVSTTNVGERLAPGIYLDLDKNFFKSKIINAPKGKLLNNTIFKDYFKGVYFQTDYAASSTSDGAMAMLNFAQGKIVIKYKDKNEVSDTSPTVRKTLTLNMSGNTVNLLESDYSNPVTSPNTLTGDEKLYLKGGAGSMAIIDLFSTGEIESIKNKKVLINDATLTFYVDNATLGTTAPEPNRVYLYDLTNDRPLMDYYFDSSTRSSTKYNKFVQGGTILDASSNVVPWESNSPRGFKYKLNLTNHIRNIINKDSTNVKLGLVITENINNYTNVSLKNTFSLAGKTKKYTPSMNVANPFGTILYGTNPIVPNDKKIKFEIWYTKPD